MTVEYRITEAITRHGPDAPNAKARPQRVRPGPHAAPAVAHWPDDDRRRRRPACRPCDDARAPAAAHRRDGDAASRQPLTEIGQALHDRSPLTRGDLRQAHGPVTVKRQRFDAP